MINQAKWIYAPDTIGTVSPEFRKSFRLSETPVMATVNVTALGVYDLSVNAQKIGDAVMAPGWTDYNRRIQYQTYDITGQLKAGENTIGICAGKGWAIGRLVWKKRRTVFSDRIEVIAHITLEYRDGTKETLMTDDSWQVYTTGILDSELYDGETYDATAEIRCMGNALVNESTTDAVLVPQAGAYIREQERVAAKEWILTPKGERVIDFGQNLAGYVEIRVKGRRGDRIVISHAEVLDKEGNFYTDNYRTAQNRNVYVLSGGEDVFKPHFCFQGYRYIRLDEYPFDEIDLSCFTSVAVYSDLKRTGHFVCGNEKINQLYSNILWGQRSNFVDVPTDCPQRDERLGWTGDAQVFCRTACINYHTEKFFRKWLGDMMLDQTPGGGVGDVIPVVEIWRISAAWGDAATICPWEVYLAYGNREMLREHYGMMKKWVEYMHSSGEEEFLWMGGAHYGDWLAMDSVGNICEGATQTDLIASAFFAYSTELVIRAGKVLGEDTSYFEKLYQNVRQAFRRAFMKNGLPVLYPKCDGLTTDRPVKGETQTAIVLILKFGLCEDKEREGLVNRLIAMIRENGGCMSTGFVGTPHILHALSENGRIDAAYDLLLQEKNPSWLFSVNQGATTIWEHWDSLKEDGSFWSTSMNSFNHYAYGSVFDWLFGVASGIRVEDDGAGYRHVSIAPHPDRRLGFVENSVETAGGVLASSWHYHGNELRYEIEIPEGTVADLTLPGQAVQRLSAGSYLFVRKA